MHKTAEKKANLETHTHPGILGALWCTQADSVKLSVRKLSDGMPGANFYHPWHNSFDTVYRRHQPPTVPICPHPFTQLLEIIKLYSETYKRALPLSSCSRFCVCWCKNIKHMFCLHRICFQGFSFCANSAVTFLNQVQ